MAPEQARPDVHAGGRHLRARDDRLRGAQRGAPASRPDGPRDSRSGHAGTTGGPAQASAGNSGSGRRGTDARDVTGPQDRQTSASHCSRNSPPASTPVGATVPLQRLAFMNSSVRPVRARSDRTPPPGIGARDAARRRNRRARVLAVTALTAAVSDRGLVVVAVLARRPAGTVGRRSRRRPAQATPSRQLRGRARR